MGKGGRVVNICTVPGCRNHVNAAGLCKPHEARLDRYGDVLAHIPIADPRMFGRKLGVRAMHGPFACNCPIARVEPRSHTCVCGYPVVHLMTPRIREEALRKQAHLLDQTVETVELAT